MADTRWLEKRRQGWFVVVYVPPRLQGTLGKKLRRSLKTRDLRVAQVRRHQVIGEFKAAIAKAERPGVAPLREEAFAWRAEMERANRGEQVNTLGDPDAPEAQEGLLSSLIVDRADAIAAEHGEAVAGAFARIAHGKETPLLHHLADWLHEGGEQGPYQPRTKRQLERDIRELEGWLTGVKLAPVVEAIDRRVAARFVTEHLSRSGRERKTVQRIVSACRSYWTWLGRKGIADDDRNPWNRQAPPKVRNGGHAGELERPFTDAEVVALLNGPAGPELADLMRVAALTGMRIDEPYRLTVLDCGGGVFNVRRAKTNSGVRRVPIHPDLAPIVARRIAGKKPSAFLFHEAGPLRAGRERSMPVSKRFGHYRQRDGVNVDERAEGKRRSLVNFHSFRRWFITTALRNGQPEHVVQQVVGQKLQGVTLGVYFGGDTPERLRECVEAVRLPAGVVGPAAGDAR